MMGKWIKDLVFLGNAATHLDTFRTLQHTGPPVPKQRISLVRLSGMSTLAHFPTLKSVSRKIKMKAWTLVPKLWSYHLNSSKMLSDFKVYESKYIWHFSLSMCSAYFNKKVACIKSTVLLKIAKPTRNTKVRQAAWKHWRATQQPGFEQLMYQHEGEHIKMWVRPSLLAPSSLGPLLICGTVHWGSEESRNLEFPALS